LIRLLDTYPRVVIAGGPRCGKTTLAEDIEKRNDRRVFYDTEFRRFDWPAVPHAMIGATAHLDRFCLESVNVGRALRKGLKVDAVIYLHKPHVPRTSRQIAMAKGVHTIFNDWRTKDRETPVFVLG
jgi:hypothetical protein